MPRLFSPSLLHAPRAALAITNNQTVVRGLIEPFDWPVKRYAKALVQQANALVEGFIPNCPPVGIWPVVDCGWIGEKHTGVLSPPAPWSRDLYPWVWRTLCLEGGRALTYRASAARLGLPDDDGLRLIGLMQEEASILAKGIAA